MWTLSEKVSPNRQGELLSGDAACQWGALKGRLKQLALHLLHQQPSLGLMALQVRVIHSIQLLTATATAS